MSGIKMKVKTNFVPKHSKKFITAGKEYEFYPFMSGEFGGDIYDDKGNRIAICVKNSDWLDGRDWKIVEN